MSPEVPNLGRRMWGKFVIGGVLIVLLVAAATTTAGLMEVGEIASALRQNKPLDLGDEVTRAEAGDPQTILLLGSDVRYADREAGVRGNSDTIMLVRLNPDAQATTVMNIPRDLKWPVDGSGVDKINAAYSIGGPKLTVKALKKLLGIKINHVVNVDFRGFRAIIDRLNCVYIDVDRRYFNDNSSGVNNYATIDVKPGYQKLCGQDALDYARFRHEDTDFVRSARQQDFLRQARAQVTGSELYGDRKRLLRIFGKFAQTDRSLQDTSDVLRLLKLALYTAKKPVAQVAFPAIMSPDPANTFLDYDKDKLRKAVKAFEDGRAKGASADAPKLKPTSDERKAGRKRKRRKASSSAPGLERAPDAGAEQARAIRGQVPYPVFYPTLRTTGGQYADVAPRVYKIRADGKSHPSYRMVIKKGIIGEYYGVQGTAWKDPPLLRDPSEEVELGNRTYKLIYDGRKLRIVAFETDDAVYWVSNTLTETLSNKQMLAIAKSLRPAR